MIFLKNQSSKSNNLIGPRHFLKRKFANFLLLLCQPGLLMKHFHFKMNETKLLFMTSKESPNNSKNKNSNNNSHLSMTCRLRRRQKESVFMQTAFRVQRYFEIVNTTPRRNRWTPPGCRVPREWRQHNNNVWLHTWAPLFSQKGWRNFSLCVHGSEMSPGEVMFLAVIAWV